MIDFEDWQPGTIQPEDLRRIAEHFLGAPGTPVSQENANEMLKSIEIVRARSEQVKAELAAEFQRLGEVLPQAWRADPVNFVERLTGVRPNPPM